jgi:hypothetical protein
MSGLIRICLLCVSVGLPAGAVTGGSWRGWSG